MKETYLTKEGLKDLQEKLLELKTVRRREIADAIHTAKEQGDLSENAEYVSAKEEQRRIETKIAELEVALKNAHVITHVSKHEVNVGTIVKLNCNGQEIVYRIVGSNEADPMAAKISNESPMGQALMGRKKGEKILIPTPAGEKDCEVIEIL
ncbi:MAG: transcription elongation factor GreA [Candidatus Andersenbacteria bacterium RIFCSPHIGHO2_12_FULL_46_9]|nr:MAG: Transcription elongation factor GreA [Parcubacteria group bacterium GW2011_GWA2_45_14]OGY34785.1 MAG: transcription elongation factor GreA [Candidatus Andersenbacteria bacterium RIFCSPHIGHO2_02_FULL_46_16]OGY35920.1 MAG: transcription elongation factor GreA [Candidatus Andersenbacteria bacterium RIFCSPHIGHO2_12_FULL_46_9]OGY38140.1 MAG: transcription elongation factor GreA [Candidatus Andersenbacteria bacterium RIFCSPLOWO2_02_FULL_46_11]OGY41057.1 MAG: transcription elongation factor Gr